MNLYLAVQALAHHEAGHLVVAWKQGVSFGGVCLIEPDDDHPIRLGLPDPALPDESDQKRLQVEKYVRACLAGPIAQRKFKPRTVRRNQTEEDFGEASAELQSITAPGKHFDTYMELLRIETSLLVEEHWGLLEALAAELLATVQMSGRQIKRFLEGWHQSQT
jgi:hypothetical protein